jgi:hypothetical protein
MKTPYYYLTFAGKAGKIAYKKSPVIAGLLLRFAGINQSLLLLPLLHLQQLLLLLQGLLQQLAQ